MNTAQNIIKNDYLRDWSINDKITFCEYYQKRIPLTPNLYPHQQKMLEKNPSKHLLAFSTGTGKTITAIALANKNATASLLVIAPKTNVKMWCQELSKFIKPETYCMVLSKEEFKSQAKTLFAFDVVIVDECFVAGTKVKTINGYKNIEDIKIGEVVYNACGIGKVQNVGVKEVDEIYKIKLSNGKEIECTGEHPFLTTNGWVKVKDLILDNSELLHYCKVYDMINLYDINLRSLQKQNNKNLSWEGKENMLKELSDEIDVDGTWEKNSQGITQFIQKRQDESSQFFGENEEKQSHEEFRDKIEDVSNIKNDWTQAKNTGWEWERNANSTKSFINSVREWLVCRAYCNNKKCVGGPKQLQNRYCKSEKAYCYRSGWSKSLLHFKEKSRQKERRSFEKIRVESIQIQKSGSDGKFKVYNLEVSGHPSYIVEDIVVHNCHYFFGIKSQMSKALAYYNKKHSTKYLYLATATPYLSTPMNIYVAGKLLGANWNYQDFINKFFYYLPMGHRSIPVQRKGMEEEVSALVSQIGTTVDMEEVADVPEPELNNYFFDNTEEQNKAILDFFDPEFIVRFTKKHTMENGFFKNDDGEIVYLENKKEEFILNFAKENKKFIVVARYIPQLNKYKQLLEKDGYKTLELNGSIKDRQSVIDEANKLEKVILLIQASCSAGFELPTFKTMIFASLSFSLVDYVQMIGRIQRINALQECQYIHLTQNGVDRDIKKCIDEKQDFTLAIYGKEYGNYKLKEE